MYIIIFCILLFILYYICIIKENYSQINGNKDVKLFSGVLVKENIKYMNRKKIHIWRGEREDNTFYFMCKPIELSILNLVKYDNNDIIIDCKFDYTNFDEINSNDILIWIGEQKKPDFNLLKQRNIYTIFYNIEPHVNKYDSDEIWTYSKYLFDKYEKNHINQIIKFIPIICEENIPFVPYNIANNNINLIFFGVSWSRSDKYKKLLESSLLKDNLKEIYNLWNDNDYNNFINSKPNIFLNLTKHMPDTEDYVLPSVRINKLLSHKAIIISEHTNPIDEAYYKDMVYFCNLEEIEDVYKKLISKTNIELEQISNDIYDKFYNKFYYKNAVKLITEK